MSAVKGLELTNRSTNSRDGHEPARSSVNGLSDDQELIRLGKRPILKRNFGFMSILGFSCTVLITWEGVLVGGPAGVIWDFLIVWTGTCSTFATIAELASMAPTAGGQYHWVAMLAPYSVRNFLAYVTAWVTVAGWQALSASSAYLIGTIIEGLIILTHPNYAPKPWQTILFFWAVVCFAVFINTVTSRALANFEGVILVLHLFGFFAVLIPLVYFGPHSNASVFVEFLNEGHWPTQALSFFVGLPAPVFCLLGADSAVHMSEEIQRASVVVPQALMLSLVINGVLGFAMILALMLCIGDVEAALGAIKTLGYPFLEIFVQAVNSVTGACLMAGLIVALGICSTVGGFAAASRMLWSLSRDRGTPFWKVLSRLDARTSIPIYTIGVTTFISMLLSLIILGSSLALVNITSLTVAGLYSSYLLSTGMLLWRRTTGVIKPHSDAITDLGTSQLCWGPWRIPEPFGTFNNVIACLYLVLILFWSFWPQETPVTPSTMNFSVLVFGGTVLFSGVWYFLRARKHFNGPVMEIEL
ncbi:hypothetical protein N7G274_009729 [Stereocaulon virgatum]|uniref:Amino acid transporter n=1 Tax=Stereocaulon virgatum TaxID=373712 RepID=A0ABR3ZWA0_9LECA